MWDRFDRMLYLGVSDTHEAQLNILEALTRKFRLDPDLDLRTIANKCPFNYTGADFYALCSDAMLNAMSRKAEEIEDKIRTLDHPFSFSLCLLGYISGIERSAGTLFASSSHHATILSCRTGLTRGYYCLRV